MSMRHKHYKNKVMNKQTKLYKKLKDQFVNYNNALESYNTNGVNRNSVEFWACTCLDTIVEIQSGKILSILDGTNLNDNDYKFITKTQKEFKKLGFKDMFERDFLLSELT